MMSRPVAGVRKNTIILTLPGSPKGAKENLLAVLKLLSHACVQAMGQDSRILHSGGVKKLEQDAGLRPRDHKHTHEHNHNTSNHIHNIPKAHTRAEDRPISNDPRAGATARQRISPYPMLSVEQALELIIQHSPQPLKTEVSVNQDLLGHTLAEDVTADEAVPAYRASIVDGYAVIVPSDRNATNKGVFPVASVSHAAPGEIRPLEIGQIARITTGAPLPPQSNAVVMVEDTVIHTMTDNGKEEKTVEILTDDRLKEGENVREIGSDIKLGEIVLKAGEEISTAGGELGLLAAVGKSVVAVFQKPVVGLLSTGDEIVPHDRPGPLRLGEVRDCNRLTLLAAVKSWGYPVVDLGIASDEPGALEVRLRHGLKAVDVIITSGGVSMGELDLLKPTIERSLGGTIHFGRVSMKPGKPTTFATVPFKDSNGHHQFMKPVFSLPGNPASALVTAHLFVLPCLQKMSGKPKPWGLPTVRVRLEEDVKCDAARAEYHRVGLRFGDDGVLQACSTGGQRSSRVGSLRGATGLLCLPSGGGLIKKSSFMDSLLMGDLRGL